MKKWIIPFILAIAIAGSLVAEKTDFFTINIRTAVKVKESGKVYLRDTGNYLYSGADGKVSLVADGSGTDDITLSGTVTGNADWYTTGGISGKVEVGVDNVTTDTLTAAESGKTFYFSADSGAYALVLPVCSASLVGTHYKFVFGVADNDAFVLKTGDVTDTTGDMFVGSLLYCAAAAVNTMEQAGANENTITLDDNLANSGRGPGTWFEVVCINATTWFVSGVVEGDSDADGVGSAIFSNSN